MRNLIENRLEELGMAIIKIDNNYMVVKDAEVVYYCGEDYSSCLRYICVYGYKHSAELCGSPEGYIPRREIRCPYRNL